MDAKNPQLAAAEAVARIDSRIRDKLLKRARKHGMTDREAVELAEAWKQAAENTKYLQLPSRAQRPPRSVGE
jgi:hypothetical protein